MPFPITLQITTEDRNRNRTLGVGGREYVAGSRREVLRTSRGFQVTVYWWPALRRVVASHSRPSYRPSPEVAQVDWMYCRWISIA